MKKLAIVLLFALTAHAATFQSGSPATTNNDDSCDVAALPAATLLLPYFEVDITKPPSTARTTLFTVVNTSKVPQIARVTLWTDLGYPVLNFNIFLTGYDAQSINLYDVLVRGFIAGLSGTTNTIIPGDRSLPNDANPNFAPGAAVDCIQSGGPIPGTVLESIDTAFTRGAVASCGLSQIGLAHTLAIGYATIDVVKTCTLTLPNTPDYYSDLLYDNTLTGDYQTINPNAAIGNYAGGNPLVHIRAIPEGGAAGTAVATNLPYTFYDRYTPAAARSMDRRQPLPAAFIARVIQGGPTAFDTDLRVWREGISGNHATCSDYAKNVSKSMAVAQIVRFDEHENATANTTGCPPVLCQPVFYILPEASSTVTSSGLFPPTSITGDLGGWLYLNLNNAGSSAYSAARHSQNWAVVSMSAEGRFSVSFDATMLANGCTAAPAVGATIGPP